MAHEDRRLVFIAQDAPFEQLRRELPAQHIHEGINEAHCVGMATALALDGFIPYIFGTASFVVRRCYEQLLLDACLHNAPVRVIGAAAGSFYAHWGPTHVCLDDVSLMRCLPGMSVCAPSCAEEVASLLPQYHERPGPHYLRLTMGKQHCADFHTVPPQFGKAYPVRQGKDVMLITCGALLQPAHDAVQSARACGVDAGLLHMGTLIPFDTETLLEQTRSARTIITVEDHFVTGGLGSMVAEVLAEAGALSGKRFKRLGAPVGFLDNYGSQAEHLAHYGLDVRGIADAINTLNA